MLIVDIEVVASSTTVSGAQVDFGRVINTTLLAGGVLTVSCGGAGREFSLA
jgi:hypothetical protein